MVWYPNVIAIGEPGSGKSVNAARDAIAFPGAAIIQDPHKDSLGQLVLTHIEANVLLDRISDDHALNYGLLKPSRHPDPARRLQQNQRRAQFFVEVLMRRRGGDIAAAPLMEEWILALLMLFLYQAVPKTPDFIPYGLMPDTSQFRTLLSDCRHDQVRRKFESLEKLKPRALRAEVGSAARLANAVFQSQAFLDRCRSGFEFGQFIQDGGKLIVERGDENEDVNRTIMGGINMLATEHCENRAVPHSTGRHLFRRMHQRSHSGEIRGAKGRRDPQTRSFMVFRFSVA